MFFSSPLCLFAHRLTTRRATPSDGPILIDLTHGLQALTRDPEGLVDDTLRDGEARRRGRCGIPVAVAVAAVDLAVCARGGGGGGVAVGGDGGARAGLGAAADVVEDAAQKVRIRGDFAGAEEGKRVGADGGGPVGGVGVEGVEERVLDPGEKG